MTDRAFLARLRIEPLDRDRHDRAAFRCGVDRVDNFLQKTAARQQDADHTRVYVACIDDSVEVIGYYALNAHAIDVTTLPEEARSKLPTYPTISAVYLAMVGFHLDHRGKGGGTFLMMDAFKRSVGAANIIGAYFLVLDALNERAAKLYRELGFVDLPGHGPRMLIAMKRIRQAIAATG
ncbi:MAG: GNAT family N-acetyltransferase [Pseudomonadota bacterium]